MHYLNLKINLKLVENLMHNFVVHLNDSACRKSGSLGLEQVQLNYMDATPWLVVN